MKVAITGHTRGIGKSIWEYFISKGNYCIGYSRTNGYNILNDIVKQKIVAESKDSDIFVNNACSYTDHSQLTILKNIWEEWKDCPEKIIINISSEAGDLVDNPSYPHKAYAIQKHQQDEFCRTHTSGPWIINLKPGLVDTDSVRGRLGSKMSPEVFKKILEVILDSKEDFKIRTVTFQLF